MLCSHLVTGVEVVFSYRCLGVHITDNLIWSNNTSYLIRKAHQHLYVLRRLRRRESVLCSCITVWHSSCSVAEKEAQRVVEAAHRTVGHSLSTVTDIYSSRCRKEGLLHHEAPHSPYTHTVCPPPLSRGLWTIKSRTTSFYMESVRLFNSGGPL